MGDVVGFLIGNVKGSETFMFVSKNVRDLQDYSSHKEFMNCYRMGQVR